MTAVAGYLQAVRRSKFCFTLMYRIANYFRLRTVKEIMVNTGQPSDGCIQCRARKVKVSFQGVGLCFGRLTSSGSVMRLDQLAQDVLSWALYAPDMLGESL